MLKRSSFILFLCIMMWVCAGCTSSKAEYQITKEMQGEGDIQVVSTAKEGEKVQVDIQPESGYYLSSFKINGTDEIGAVQDNAYMISDIKEDTKIVAEFRPGVAYASQKPVIDGKIDDCWSNASKLYTEGHVYVFTDDETKQNTGYASLMWDEQHLYLLAVVRDRDISEGDRTNFWISETFIESKEGVARPYSADARNGMYYTVVNPYGEHILYSSTEGRPVDFSTIDGYQCKTSTFQEDKGGYIIEAVIPKQSSAKWMEGHLLGFDISIDTYYTGETTRATSFSGIEGVYHDLYCYWNGAGAYWEDASQLGQLRFIK